jgi:ATP-dependent RNA helicase DDX19/DBP5
MSEADSTTKAPSGSLFDRVNAPPNANSSSATPTTTPAASKTVGSWADEVASPVNESESSLAKAQMDGSSEPLGGSMLHDGQFDVEVKLSDIQGDVNSPLYSAKTFEELGM